MTSIIAGKRSKLRLISVIRIVHVLLVTISQRSSKPIKHCVPAGLALTLTEILPSSLGRCAARNQSPGSGLVTLNAPVVRFGRVHVSVTANDPGTAVSPGKRVRSGLITGGAPDLKYLKSTGRTVHFETRQRLISAHQRFATPANGKCKWRKRFSSSLSVRRGHLVRADAAQV